MVMHVVSFTLLIWLGGLAAGLLGALTGLGGGVVIVPLLTLVFGVDLRYALGASLISVIATSSGAASAYVREGYSNIRIGMFLEIATTLGAIAGATLTTVLPPNVIAVLFGGVLILSSCLSSRRPHDNPDGVPDRWTAWLRLAGTYPTAEGEKPYHARHAVGGFGLMTVAGLLSGLLGIGPGALKVLAMDWIMCLPFKVSTTTSNFMIGVTAAASAGIYLGHGYVEPALAMPVVLGVLPGSMIGSYILGGASVRLLRLIFTLTILALGIEMIYNGLTGGFQ
jgi:hypothetical protein